MATNRSLRPPEQHLSRKSSSSSLYTAAPSEASSGPGGKNFVYADGLLSPPATVPSSVSGNSVRGGVPGGQPDSSVADTSSNGGSESASNIESWNKQAIKALKPQSRTAIGRLSYSLNRLPRLLIVDLHIETETTNGKWEQVKSSRLRGLAAKEWLANPSLANDKHRASLKIGAGQSGSRVDARIAFRLDDEGQRARTRSKIQNMSTKPLTTTKKKLKSSTTKRAVRCRVAEIKDHKDPAAFKESLAHMLRAISQDSDFLKDYLMGKTVDACLPHPDKVGDLSSKFRLYIRTQPSIDPEKRLIDFDFDLVPGLPGTDAEDLLSTLFGTHPTADLINRNMDALRYTLCGLQARCIYKPISKMTNNRANIQLLRAADDSCRKVQIQDVQAHGVPTFKVRTESSEVTIKVADYFSEVRIGGQPLDTALPFVKDNTGAWIPLELLTFEGLQPLLSFGHRNEAIRGEVRRFLKAGGVTMLYELADDLIARCGLLDTSTTASVKPWLDVSKPGSLLRLSSLKPSARQHEIEPIQSHIGLLQIDDPGEGYYGNVLEWGLNLRYQSVARKSLNSADAIIDPAKMRIGEVQLLIAMVNDLGDTTNKAKDVKNIIARLHRAAETDLGLPLICTTYSHLETRIEKTVTPRDHVPTDTYAKIDYMLGLPRPGQSKPLSDGDTMIVGAHVISQAPNGEKLPYHPTITAVVASKDTTALRYNGSVRIQSATRKETVPVKDPNESTTYSRTIREGIEHLGDMMRELFKQRNGSIPTRILFFRDSVDFDNNVVRTEIQYIRDAYKTEYHDTELLLTYIVVNKNTAITYKTVDEPDTTKVVPEFDYLATGDSHAKHRYYVVCNDMNEIPANLANFTSRLNASFPLNPHGQTSKALPLLHASKLACRVRDYFYYDVPEVKISRAKKPTSDSLELESLEEDRANKDIKEYLGINNPEARQLPWKEQLDGTMFFL